MRPSRAVISVLVTLLVLGGGFVSAAATAQDATPTAQGQGQNPMPGPAGAGGEKPGQYVFYPSQVAQPGGDLPGDPRVQLVRVGGDFQEPVNVVAPPDGSGRIFVVERGGTVRIVDAAGNQLPDPFLDITGQVMDAFLEQGLLGMAFHPNYAQNGVFYVNYTNLLRSGDVLTVQYNVSADNPNLADPDSGKIIMFRAQPYPNHIGGDIVFGPDGCLYIGHGDGGLEGDPLNAGQDLTTHLGKLLRIDVNPALGEPPCGGGPATKAGAPAAQTVDGGGFSSGLIGEGYQIPAGNPFTQGDELLDLFGGLEEADFAEYQPFARPEIFAYGLRNPWQFSFDRQTGDLWIGDVGQNFWEEVDFAPAGQGAGWNFGWKFLQGSHCFPIDLEPDCPKVGVLPVAEYPHNAEDNPSNGITVVGGAVYRGQDFPSLQGIYFLSDYGTGRVWGVARGDDGLWQMQELLDTTLLVTGSGEDEAGNLYFASCQCGYGQDEPNPAGQIWRLVAADQVPPGAETAQVEQGSGPATQAVGEGIGDATPGVATPGAGG